MKRWTAQRVKLNPGAEEDVNEGVWYYVYFKPHWLLLIEYDGGHWKFWNDRVAEKIWQHYKIKNVDKRRLLFSLQHSMPRGRVSRDKDGSYVVLHGNDFPAGASREHELDKIYSAFGLTNRIRIGAASERFWNHETMNPKEQKDIQEIIGKVPY